MHARIAVALRALLTADKPAPQVGALAWMAVEGDAPPQGAAFFAVCAAPRPIDASASEAERRCQAYNDCIVRAKAGELMRLHVPTGELDQEACRRLLDLPLFDGSAASPTLAASVPGEVRGPASAAGHDGIRPFENVEPHSRLPQCLRRDWVRVGANRQDECNCIASPTTSHCEPPSTSSPRAPCNCVSQSVRCCV